MLRLATFCTGILYYDYTLTFSAEVDRFWKGRFSFASFIFYFNRYLALSGHIPVLYEFYGTHDQKVSQHHDYVDKQWLIFSSVAVSA